MIKLIILLELFVLANCGLLPQECGKPLISNQDHWRIVNGQNTSRGEFPWQVLITLKPGIQTEFPESDFCGGTLINDQWVLTAAHCVAEEINYKPSDLIVRLGVYNLTLKEDTEVDVEVEKVVVHEKWDSNEIANDIALLKIKVNNLFVEHKNLRPVCVDRDNITLTKKCVATGYGMAIENGKGLAHPSNGILHKIDDPLTDPAKCIKLFGSAFNPEHNVCAGGSSTRPVHATCHGDSGGPLQCLADDGRWYQVGITSFGSGSCNELNSPDVFTKVKAYVQWIETTIQN